MFVGTSIFSFSTAMDNETTIYASSGRVALPRRVAVAPGHGLRYEEAARMQRADGGSRRHRPVTADDGEGAGARGRRLSREEP